MGKGGWEDAAGHGRYMRAAEGLPRECFTRAPYTASLVANTVIRRVSRGYSGIGIYRIHHIGGGHLGDSQHRAVWRLDGQKAGLDSHCPVSAGDRLDHLVAGRTQG